MKIELNHAELSRALRLAAPSIIISTEWDFEQFNAEVDWRELSQWQGGAFHGEERDDWTCWQTTVTARAIISGELVKGCDYLGAIWEKYGDDPRKSNPEISGYFPQLVEGALKEMAEEIPAGHPLHGEIAAAIALL